MPPIAAAPRARSVRLTTALLPAAVAGAAVLMLTGCAAPATTAGTGAVPETAPSPRTADTVTVALLEEELMPALDTRPFAVVSEQRPAGGPVARLVELAPADTLTGPVLRLALLRPGADPRDLLDSAAAGETGTVDLLVTRDPGVIAYARTRPGYSAEPLPWDRVYVAIVTDPSRTRIAPSPEFRAALARDAVRADARAAGDGRSGGAPYPWETAACDGTGAGDGPGAAAKAKAKANASSGAGAGRRPARRVGYPAGDPIAQDLAERLVALDGTVTAAALPGDRFAASLAAGADAVYVVRLSAVPEPGGRCATLPPHPPTASIVPLIESRPHALIRAGSPRMIIAPGAVPQYAP